MISVTRIAHVAFRTARLEAMEAYFTDVLGLWVCQRDHNGATHLTGGGAGAFVELTPADLPALDP